MKRQLTERQQKIWRALAYYPAIQTLLHTTATRLVRRDDILVFTKDQRMSETWFIRNTQVFIPVQRRGQKLYLFLEVGVNHFYFPTQGTHLDALYVLKLDLRHDLPRPRQYVEHYDDVMVMRWWHLRHLPVTHVPEALEYHTRISCSFANEEPEHELCLELVTSMSWPSPALK